MNRRLDLLAVLLACLWLPACVGLPGPDIRILGQQIFTTPVDFPDIYTYGSRADAAYDTPAAIRAKYPDTVRVATPGTLDTQYFLEQNDRTKVQYVSVRGTANRRNVAEDAAERVREDREVDIPVHRGFDLDARAIYGDVKPYLKKDYKIYLTGHSLGGAVAAVLAIYLHEDGYQVARVVTFGQPKFTTAEGARKLGFLPLTRIVDENDVVPLLPPAMSTQGLFGPYAHVGPEVILLDGPHYVLLPSVDAMRISIGDLWRSLRIADIGDHHMARYLRRIADKIPKAVAVSYDSREQYVAKPKNGAKS